MNITDPTSLDRLHDIVVPDPISWWPPTPIWYVIAMLTLLVSVVAIYRFRVYWHSNAYRRTAVRELAEANSALAIGQLLRRVALSCSSRTTIAALGGAEWVDWLANRIDVPMPESVREQLIEGVYGRPSSADQLSVLRQYASVWIQRHPSSNESEA
ncbi:MAG: DUF4381 domain-containing protein [Planctomycetaceae bacterium]|nr:DUF4381 domain-containing protein [Planctomycetaceae bacterium]